jgi:hypothetical protein
MDSEGGSIYNALLQYVVAGNRGYILEFLTTEDPSVFDPVVAPMLNSFEISPMPSSPSSLPPQGNEGSIDGGGGGMGTNAPNIPPQQSSPPPGVQLPPSHRKR